MCGGNHHVRREPGVGMSLEVESSSRAEERDKSSASPKFMKVEWVGQTAASLCWICSMYFYGLDSYGDWLQLAAGLAWFIANIASMNEQ